MTSEIAQITEVGSIATAVLVLLFFMLLSAAMYLPLPVEKTGDSWYLNGELRWGDADLIVLFGLIGWIGLLILVFGYIGVVVMGL